MDPFKKCHISGFDNQTKEWKKESANFKSCRNKNNEKSCRRRKNPGMRKLCDKTRSHSLIWDVEIYVGEQQNIYPTKTMTLKLRVIIVGIKWLWWAPNHWRDVFLAPKHQTQVSKYKIIKENNNYNTTQTKHVIYNKSKLEPTVSRVSPPVNDLICSINLELNPGILGPIFICTYSIRSSLVWSFRALTYVTNLNSFLCLEFFVI